MSRFEPERAARWRARLNRPARRSFADLVRAHVQQIRTGVSAIGMASLLGSLAAAAAAASTAPRLLETQRLLLLAQRIGEDLSEPALQRFAAAMEPGARLLALRYDPAQEPSREAPSWAGAADAPPPPGNDLRQVSADQAVRLNAALPFSSLPNPAAAPFVLRAGAAGAAQALTCLTAAVYFEAASESEAGQAAVAQVVLNRVRHPTFPKSVCGVVFQGAGQRTGCQFTFTCDGSLARRPDAAGWARARRVAARALEGHVMAAVGEATHYHAEWVFPAWGPQLVKLTRIGAHIFYRWNGAAGRPGAFTSVYAGEDDGAWADAEVKLVKVGLVEPATQAPARAVELAPAQAPVIAPLQLAPRPQPAPVELQVALAPRMATVQAPAFSVIAQETARPRPRIAAPSDW